MSDGGRRTVSLRRDPGAKAGREPKRCVESCPPVTGRGLSHRGKEKDRLSAGTGHRPADGRDRPSLSPQPHPGTSPVCLPGASLHQQHLQGAGAGRGKARHSGCRQLPDCRKRQTGPHFCVPCRIGTVLLYDPVQGGLSAGCAAADCLRRRRCRQSH